MINRKPKPESTRKAIDYIKEVICNYNAGITTSYEASHALVRLLDIIEDSFLCSAMSYRDFVELSGLCILILDEINDFMKLALNSVYGRSAITTDDEVNI